METKTRVLIADSSDDYRNLITLFLRDEDDMELVGSAKDGTEALCMLEDLKPDVLLTEMARSLAWTGSTCSKSCRKSAPIPAAS